MSSYSTEAPEPRVSVSAVPGAALWVLVSGALLYGVVKTVDTAAALFAGA